MPLPDLPVVPPPQNGTTVELAPGLLWLRLALPFRLNHVNVYLLDEGDGWLLIDTGADDERTRSVWSALLDAGKAGPLGGKPLRRILATHFHPDHVGAASFLAGRTGASFLMSEVEYLTALNLVKGDAGEAGEIRTALYRQNGAPPDQIEAAAGNAMRYRSLVPGLPGQFSPLRSGDVIQAGARRLTVSLAAGHAPAQALLHEETENLLFVADQVLTRISPNVGILDRSPDDNPLAAFLASLDTLNRTIPNGGLVLPGHHMPFRVLHERIDELVAHHGDRCRQIEAACAMRGLTIGELVPILFPFSLDPHQYWFAFSEVAAHLNYLESKNRLERRTSHGRHRWGPLGRLSHAPA